MEYGLRINGCQYKNNESALNNEEMNKYLIEFLNIWFKQFYQAHEKVGGARMFYRIKGIKQIS